MNADRVLYGGRRFEDAIVVSAPESRFILDVLISSFEEACC